MQNKGFTLIESLMILFIISIIILLTPMYKIPEQYLIHNEMQKIYQRIQQAQALAMVEKRKVYVDFHGNVIAIDKKPYRLNKSIRCKSCRFYFTPSGSVSQANTITCVLNSKIQKLTIQLGSGIIYAQ